MRALVASFFALACVLPLPGQAQSDYPNRPIRMLVGYTAGGSVDATARAIAERLGPALGTTVVVENRAGATGNIAAVAAARAAPDGYTLFMSTSITAVSLSLVKNLNYHPLNSFAPIARGIYATNVLVSHPSIPAKNVKELVEHIRARPGKITYATTGAGGSPHLAAELMSMLANVKMVHVPYQGGAPAMNDLLGGHVDISFSNPTSVMPHIATGRIRGYATTGRNRFSGLPDLPTMMEEGYPGFDLSAWYGIVAPAGTPPEIVKRLNTEIVKILNSAEVKDLLLKQGLDAAPSTPEEMAAEIKADIEKYARVLKAAGIEAK